MLFGFSLVAVIVLLSTASPASADTGGESSIPGDGQTFDRPIAEISLTFSGAPATAEPVPTVERGAHAD